jgi:hypothetical protein
MRRKKAARPGNIKDDPAYDPFPKSGPIKDYDPLIRDKVAKFCKLYPHARRGDVLNAVLLAQKALDRFDPAQGNKFGTLLILYLRGLPKMFWTSRTSTKRPRDCASPSAAAKPTRRGTVTSLLYRAA